jgi:hypothetical protein
MAPNCVEYLFKVGGANKEEQDNQENTPLYFASAVGNLDGIEYTVKPELTATSE